MYELAWKMSRDTNDLVCENYMVQIDKYRVTYIAIISNFMIQNSSVFSLPVINFNLSFQLWWAIIGHTEQYLSLKTEVDR